MPSYVVGFALCAMLLALVALAGMSVYDWARRRYGRFYRLVGFWAFALGVCAADYVGGAKPDPTDAPPCLSAPIGLGAARACASPSALQLEGEGALTNGFRFTSIDRSDDSVALGLSWNGADFTTSPFIEVFSRTNLTAGGWRYVGWLQADSGETNVSLVVDADLLDADARSPSLFFSARADEGLSDDGSDDDGDGIPNVAERARGTNPRRTDSDGDGIPDAGELDFASAGAAIPELDVSSLPDAFAGTMTLAAYPAAISVNLPFAVEIAGGSSTQAIVHACGMVTFPDVESSGNPAAYTYDDTPAILYADRHAVVSAYGFPFAMLGYFGAELRTGTVYASNGRWFVAEWRNFMDMMEYVTFSFGCATFQLAVSEADPTTVYVRYLSLADAYDGTSAIIGSHGLNGRQELLVANDEPGSVSTGMTLTYHWGRGTDPLDPDSDGDGLPDGWEVAYGMDPLVHNGTLADPRFAPDADPDRDLLTNRREAELGTNPFQPDSDGDGMDDGWEDRHRAWGFDPAVANADDEILKTGPGDDLDGDGLSNARECVCGTSPGDTDTDGDRVGDAEEIAQSSDPADATDGGRPASRVPVTFVFGDPSSSHSEKYRLELTPVAPTNRTVAPSEMPRSVAWANARYGACETNTVLLARGFDYEVRLFHVGTNRSQGPDYDYRLMVPCPAFAGIVLGDPTGLFQTDDGTSDRFSGEGKVATIRVLDAALYADYDRDGKIDEDDRARLYAGRVFRHWVNDDDDTGDVAADSESDIPGARTGAFELDGRDPDWDNDGVDGRCDLLDFAPVRLDIGGMLDQLDGNLSDYEFRLTQSDAALNVIWTGLGSTNAAAYLTGEVATCGAALNENSYEATVAEDDDDHRTIEIPASVLNRIRERPESGIVLVEGRAESQSPLVFECRLASGGELVFKVEMPMSISGVEKMYRWLGLRHVCDEDDVAGLSTNAPPNCPDNETDDRNFVFVHGYNVGPEAARGWAAELFKRLWQSGSRSKFTAVDWYGDDSRFSVPVAGDVSPGYYANVQHAFATARRLPAALASLQGTKVLLAHSLGNMVVSSAAVDHQLAYAKYYMLNAAVPMEAYDASSQTNAMVDSEWIVVSNRFRASGWHSLFTATNDFRSTLTWRGRFAGIRNAVNCYSETEDVLSNAQVGQAKLAGGAWKGQELTKGTTTWNWLDMLSLGLLDVSCEGGWGVSSWYGTDPTYYIYGSGFREKANTLDRATAVIAPLFTRFSAEREAMQSTNLFVVADADYARELRAKFLADAIPAESFAAGANALTAWGESRNYNFQSKIPNGWPKLDDDDNPVWEHSDLKNVAYFYVYELFKKVVKETR